MKLTIGHLYPDLLNLYGDCGNLRCLQMRLRWRGIGVQIKTFRAGEYADPEKLDILLLGGGSDREQALACRHLGQIKTAFRAYVEDHGGVLAVCGGYQLLGNYYRTEHGALEGLGVLDIYTDWMPGRLTGNIVLDSPLSSRPVVGFENHGGRTYIGTYAPFGKVAAGFGNDGTSGYEGVVYKNVIGTYLHGPLLPKNPEICDHLLERALVRKYGTSARLCPLPDELEHRANQYMAARITRRRRPRFFTAPAPLGR